MSTLQGRIVGEVKFAEGDGVKMTIPRGPCELAIADLDVTISWGDATSRGATAIPLTDYRRFLEQGAIVLITPKS